MPDIDLDLPSPGEEPNWAPKLNAALMQLLDALNGLPAEFQDSTSELNQVLRDLVIPASQDAANEFLQQNPSVLDAAASAASAAVSGELSKAGVFFGAYITYCPGYGFVMLDENRRVHRWSAQDERGEPHELALDALGDAHGVRMKVLDPRYGYVLAMLNDEGKIISALRPDGVWEPEKVSTGPTRPKAPWPGLENVWIPTDGKGNPTGPLQIGYTSA